MSHTFFLEDVQSDLGIYIFLKHLFFFFAGFRKSWPTSHWTLRQTAGLFSDRTLITNSF